MIKFEYDIEQTTIGDFILNGYYQKLLLLQNKYGEKIHIITKTNNYIIVTISLHIPKIYYMNIYNIAIIYDDIANELMKL